VPILDVTKRRPRLAQGIGAVDDRVKLSVFDERLQDGEVGVFGGLDLILDALEPVRTSV
jgi:hypothetical protein